MTASSCSASLSSKHSRMSTSAMSVIAATLTSNAEVVGDGNIAGLDEFTSLLTESDARLIVDLLKLAVADRVEDEQAEDILSTLLISTFPIREFVAIPSELKRNAFFPPDQTIASIISSLRDSPTKDFSSTLS